MCRRLPKLTPGVCDWYQAELEAMTARHLKNVDSITQSEVCVW